MSRRIPALLLLAAMLAGCSVGPDFQPPQPELPEQWEAGTSPGTLDSQWWQRLGDPQLASLVERAAGANLDARIAANRLEQSRLLLAISSGDQLPSLAATGSYARERNSGEGLSDPSGREGKAPFEMWSLAADASWELDLWGRVRREVEAADAQVQISRAERDGLLLSLAAETASDYLQLRGVQAQLAVTRQNLEIARQSQQLTQARFDNGVTTQLDVANAAAQVATVSARLPVLEAEQARLINALSALLGLAPRALREELIAARPLPRAEDEAPLGLPSELARRRPDILRSEAALHRSTAAVGVAQADFYPRVTLGARFGAEALEGSQLDSWGARDWSYGPSLYLPLFQGGRLSGTLALREHQQQAAALDYRRTVLNAWHEVDDALSDYAAEQRHQQALAEAVHQNDLALAAARQRYREGAIDFLNVLNVQRALLDTQSAHVSSATQSALDRVRLYKALGGGWPTPGPV
ncbi:efflux transporter outer membrane subunit [Pseudomonas massiliensis]|uniref:efflux transporter outer membrane subunit n=1 Tax=Pseudomonas massiliensis TaxID=522492 RepID=UPI00058CD55E|nr:efflux transporter outer membrane subunit [Pseudomonas massiliensis]